MIDFVDAITDSPRLAILVIALFVNYFAAYVLVRESWKYPKIIALSERARAAVIIAVVLTGNALLFGERRIVAFTLPPEVAQWMSFFIAVVISLPAVYWLYLYYRRKGR